jgi:pimeloyl-ACP methyl ester carboxylesterase
MSEPMRASDVTSRVLDLGAIRMHVLEQGAGLPVVLCHGFPGLGYSFRHQLPALAAAGYRAIAPDMRGYGGTDAPVDGAAYDHDHVASDLLALLDALGEERAVFVGHDFGAPLVWHLALRAPERVAGVVALSVPYDPRRAPEPPSAAFARTAERHFFHMHYFQAEGVAERELDAAPRDFLTRLFWALGGGARYRDVWRAPAGSGYLDALPEAPPLPWPWLTAAELDVYASTFARTGFRGGLAWYRALDRNWAIAERFAGRTVEVPALYLAGAADVVVEMGGPRALERMKAHVPDLRGAHLVEGAGHWLPMERPDAVNAHLLAFLRSL